MSTTFFQKKNNLFCLIKFLILQVVLKVADARVIVVIAINTNASDEYITFLLLTVLSNLNFFSIFLLSIVRVLHLYIIESLYLLHMDIN